MSVLITGMEMPKRCYECLFENPDSGYRCRFNGKQHSWGLKERPDDCPLVEAPKWIPVTERLPQKADTYLVFVENVFQKSMTATTTALWGGQNFIVGDFVTVTHWMPLPQPPKEEK